MTCPNPEPENEPHNTLQGKTPDMADSPPCASNGDGNARLHADNPVPEPPSVSVGYEEMSQSMDMEALSSGNHTYVEKHIKYEDMKSTAGSFLFVGAIGIVALLLLWLGVLPFTFAAYMKLLMTCVMGAVFLLFLAIGIRSMQQLEPLKAAMEKEQQDKAAAEQWFFDSYSAESLDQAASINESHTMEQRYFLRSTCMRQLLMAQFPAFDEAFTEYLIEQFYEKLWNC